MITFNESLDEALQSISAAPDLMSMLDKGWGSSWVAEHF
jgi:hypothetical protein